MKRKKWNKGERMGKSVLNIKRQPCISIDEYILNFDVLNSTPEQARELVAWLQVELKIRQKVQ